MFSTSCKSIFYDDERNHRQTNKKSLESENLRINEEVLQFVKGHIESTALATEAQYSAKFSQLESMLGLLVSLEDLTYAEDILQYLRIKNMMLDVACRLSRQLQSKKNQRKGINSEVLQSGSKEAKNMSTLELLHSESRNLR